MKDEIINIESLDTALKKCVKGVSYKASVAYFYLNSADCLAKLHDELENGTYKARKPKHFTVSYPKKREIVSIAFRDRVFQRALNDLAVYPKVTKSFIYDNMACQKGKGTDLARQRLKKFMQDYWHKNGTEGYILKMDIKKYYDNIPHDVAKRIFAKHLSGWELEQVYKILDNQYPTEKGFNAGSQMIQILGIATPNEIDHYCKEKLLLKHYIRYQDDTIILHSDKKYLEYVQAEVARKLAEIGLELNTKKTKIIKLTEGCEFLGFIYRMTDKGKVLMTVCPKRVKQEYRHLRNITRKTANGELPEQKVSDHIDGVFNHYAKGNSYKLRKRLSIFCEKSKKEYANECHERNHQGEKNERVA